MRYRSVSTGILATAALASALAQQTSAFGKPRITVRPLDTLTAPSTPATLFGTVPSFIAPGADFFPAAPTTLFDNTTITGYYFPVSNITLDDVNIPASRNTDNDGVYYLTQIDVAIYVPNTAQQPVQMEVSIASADASGGADSNSIETIATFEGQLNPGGWVISFAYPRCQPREQSTVEVTDNNQNSYGRFWVGVKFPQYCAPLYSGGGPGWLMANGPDAQADVFYWEGDQNCQGNFGAGYYFFGGNPVASFYIKVLGAATREEAVVSADLDGSGCVDDADLLDVLFNFGSDGSSGGDANCDGIVDDADLLEVLFNFGSGC